MRWQLFLRCKFIYDEKKFKSKSKMQQLICQFSNFFEIWTFHRNPELLVLFYYFFCKCLKAFASNFDEYFDLVLLFKKICRFVNYLCINDELPWSICFDPELNTYILGQFDKYMSKRSESARTIHVFDHVWVRVK